MPTRTTFAVVAAALLTSAVPSIAQTSKHAAAPAKTAAAAPAAFVTKAGNGGLFEVESSKLALQKAQRADVKTFAQKMVDDHGKANQELAAEAQKAGVQAPAKLDARHQQRLDKLSAANGPGFDEAYLGAQRSAHRDAVSLFQAYARTGDNADLKQFASRTLPVIQEHERMLKQTGKAQQDGKARTGKSASASNPSTK